MFLEQKFHYLEKNIVLLGLLSTFGIVLEANTQKQCFEVDKELNYCSQKYKMKVPPGKYSGYGFGYGSLADTEYMCRTRGHILVLQCMRQRAKELCQQHTPDAKFQQIIWLSSLDTSRFEKAAAYICHEHNLRIFRQHRYGCLYRQEKRAEKCATQRNDTIQEVVRVLHNQSHILNSDPDHYYHFMRTTLAAYECKALREKLDCLYDVLYQDCLADAVRLIMNYFKETLPPGCEYNYETRLADYLKAKSSEAETEAGRGGKTKMLADKMQDQAMHDSHVERTFQARHPRPRNTASMSTLPNTSRLHSIRLVLVNISLWFVQSKLKLT